MVLLDMHVPVRIISKKNDKARGRFHGKPFLSREARALQLALTAAASRCRVEAVPYGGTVAMEITCHWPSRVHADTANVPEIICDALQGVVYENDRQIGPLLVVPCECGVNAVTVRVSTTERDTGPCVNA